jgi:hypothetical protein
MHAVAVRIRTAALSGVLILAMASPASALPLRFDEPLDLAVGDPVAIAVGRFNADTDLDLAVATDVDRVERMLGGAGASFGTAVFTNIGDAPRAVVAGNFNPLRSGPVAFTDTDLDLAVANSADGTVSILAGNGLGGFTALAPVTVGSNPRDIAVGRLNPGFDPDLAVTTAGLDRVQILRGEPTGPPERFTVIESPLVGDAPHGIATGDFDRDGDLDLATANQGTGNVSILRNNGSASFVNGGTFAAGEGARSVATGEFNGDGELDLAVVNELSDTVTVLLGRAGTSFAPAGTLATTDAPYEVAAVDLTRDGDLDLAVAGSGVGTVAVLVGRPGAGFAPPVPFAVGGEPVALAAGDFDGDSEIDLAVASVTTNVSVLRNSTPPNTTVTAGPSGLTGDATPTLAFAADEPGVTFRCRIDGAPVPCGARLTTARLADGVHIIRVAAVDPAGNADPRPAERTFTVDATAPQTTIVSGPRRRTSDFDPTFAFAAGEPGATFACRIDARPFAPCTSPHTTRLLRPGRHSFRVRAVDAVGNADSTPAARKFRAVPDRLTGADLLRFFQTFSTHTRVDVMQVIGAKRGVKIVVRCRGGRRLGCPGRLARRAVKIRVKRRGRIDLQKRLFADARLLAGAVVQVRIDEPRTKSRVIVFRILADRVRVEFACLTPGVPNPKRCRL